MGIHLNPDNTSFQMAVNSRIYVDKSELIELTNNTLNSSERFICVSSPRRFGKSTAADMLVAYYSRGCDSGEVLLVGISYDENKGHTCHIEKVVI